MIGFIYFIQVEDQTDGPIKIGFTTRQVAVRFKELQRQIPFHKLKLLGSITGNKNHETLLKIVFESYMIVPETSCRQRSEWFKSEKPVKDYIKKITNK